MRILLFLVGAFVWSETVRASALATFRDVTELTVVEGAFCTNAPCRQFERTPGGIRFTADVRYQATSAERYVIRIPPRPVERGTQVVLTVRFEATCGLLSEVAGLRFQDASGETFHYFPAETFRREDGRTSFRYDIVDGKSLHWGGDGDGRFGTENPNLVAITFGTDTGASQSDSVELLSLESVKPESGKTLLTAEVETGNALHLLWEGAARPTLALRSRANTPMRWSGVLQVCDFFGTKRDVVIDSEVPSNGVSRVDLGEVTRQGHWRVVGQLTSGPSTVRIETAFAVLSRPRDASADPHPAFRMGVNFHSFSGYDECERALAEEALTALGARLVRGSVGNFRQVEPQLGQWRWEKTDRIVNELTNRGIGIHAIVYSPPAWSIPESTRNRLRGKRGAADAKPDLAAYAEYLRRFASRYGGKISYYEIGNEWDDLFFRGVMTPQEAIELQKSAYTVLKAEDPSACVLHGGFCTADAYGNVVRRTDIERFLKGALGFYDRQTIHVHGAFGYYEQQLDTHFFPDRQRLGIEGIPWYSDESAHTSGRASEACVAATVWKKILHAQAMGSVDYIWYNLRACGGTSVEEGYGLMTRDFVPRPSFCAFAALERLIGGMEAERPLVRTGYRRIYRFTGNQGKKRRVVLAGWDSGSTPAALTVLTDAARAFAVDLMGNRTVLPCTDGRVNWSPGRLPSAVLLEDATFAWLDEEPVRLVPRPQDWTLTLERVDETNGARTAALTLSGARQRFVDSGAARARCTCLTDGTNRWNISVETSYSPIEGGYEATARIENRSDRWRIVGFSGCETELAGARPEEMSLYVPEGLGKRVNPIRQTTTLDDKAKYDESKWQDARWYHEGKSGLFFGTGWYPGAMGLTLPFVALADESQGVYLGQHDPKGRVVRFELSRATPSEGLRARSVHRTPIEPGATLMLAKTVCRRFAGDWRSAPEIYRTWNSAHRPLPEHPDWIRMVSGWLLVIMRQQNGEVIWRYGDMDRICDIADANGLDMIGLFGWTEGGHDHLYPDYVVSDEMGGAAGLRAAMTTARQRGKRVCLYANGQLQQVGGTAFWRSDGCRISLEDRAGDRHLQHYPKYKNIPKYDFALGCLHAPAWRRRMLSLAEQACAFGADGILYDQLGMTRPWLCYGCGHGHPVPANSYESERPDFLREIRNRLLSLNSSFVLMTEGLHDTIADSVACFHGCETGCFQTRLSWEPEYTRGADAWTKAYVHEADARFRNDPGVNTVFPELYRLASPELVTTVRIPSPLADRTMVNWTLLYGLRHDIELRYAPDRAYALEGTIPSTNDFSLVCSPSDVARMRQLDRRTSAEYLRRANAFQKRFAAFLLKGRFEDERGVRLVTQGRMLAKRYKGADGSCGVLVWNLDCVPQRMTLTVEGRAPLCAFGLFGEEDASSAIGANAIRLYLLDDVSTPDETRDIQARIDAAWKAGGGVVEIAPGEHRIKALRLRSNITFKLADGAALIASRDCEDYEILGADTLEPVDRGLLAEAQKLKWIPARERTVDYKHPLANPLSRWNNGILRIYQATNVTVVGGVGSVIDGRNSFDPLGEENFRGAHGISCLESTNVVVRGIELRRTGNWATRFQDCAGLVFEDLAIRGGHDGIHVRGCNGIDIRRCDIRSGDDCVAGFDNVDVTVEDCSFNTACSVFRFGGTHVRVRRCRAWGPGEWPIRNSITRADQVAGADGGETGRRNLLSFWTYFADFTHPIRQRPGDIVVEDCVVENADRFFHYNLSGNEVWQKGRPLAEIAFRRIRASGIGMSLCAYAAKSEPLVLTFDDCDISFQTVRSEFVRGAFLRELRLSNTRIRGVNGPCLRSWDGFPKIHLFNSTGFAAEKEAAVNSFSTPPI